jgi:protein-export membrane protein SecD
MSVFRAVVLIIALAIAAGSAGAQGVLEQLGGSGGGPMGARPKPEIVCKRFETALEMRPVADWSALDVIPEAPPARPGRTEAAMQSLGGTRMVMAADVTALRKHLLEQAREDVRRIVRNDRLGSPGAVVIRGETVEFQPRAGTDTTVVSKAFAPLTSGPAPPLVGRAVDDERAARGVVAFAVPDRAVEERAQSSQQVSIDIIDRRVRELGFEDVHIQPLDRGRILVVVPGLAGSHRLPFVHHSITRLSFGIAERFADPCVAAEAISADAEVLREPVTKASVLVQKRAIATGENLAGVAVVRDGRTGSPAVAVRLDRPGSGRLAEATRNNIEQGLAIVLNGEIVAMPTVRAPIPHGAFIVSGGLALEQARHLALLIRAGQLPSPLTIVEEQVFEPKPR